MRQKLGALAYDLPRFLWSMRPSKGQTWMQMRNRSEQLTRGPRGLGVRCDWQWTSDLHISKVFPSTGRRLMKNALRDWPIELRETPDEYQASPQISFIIGHRGMARLPHLLSTLQSIAAQRAVPFECLVVEQSSTPEVEEHLPKWVRYVHTALPYADLPYCRSWAFNVGARMARSEVLVMHDNDMLVPADYSAQILERIKDSYEIANLKRFIFYLNERESTGVMNRERSVSSTTPDSVVQNLEAGGSFAIVRDVFLALGGFDESFVGWGGEDNEFWERAQTRRVWPYGYLPLIHLWHAAQPGKLDGKSTTATLFESRSAIPCAERIAELNSREYGNPNLAPENLAEVGSTLLKGSLLHHGDADRRQTSNP